MNCLSLEVQLDCNWNFLFQEHMIENEILILRQVKHEHIVELIEEFETPKEILLVMELVPVKH